MLITLLLMSFSFIVLSKKKTYKGYVRSNFCLSKNIIICLLVMLFVLVDLQNIYINDFVLFEGLLKLTS